MPEKEARYNVAGDLIHYARYHWNNVTIVLFGERHDSHHQYGDKDVWSNPNALVLAEAIQRLAALEEAEEVTCLFEGATTNLKATSDLSATEWRPAQGAVVPSEEESKETPIAADSSKTQPDQQDTDPLFGKFIAPTNLIRKYKHGHVGLPVIHDLAIAASMRYEPDPDLFILYKTNPMVQSLHARMPSKLTCRDIEVRHYYELYGEAYITDIFARLQTLGKACLSKQGFTYLQQLLEKIGYVLETVQLWRDMQWLRTSHEMAFAYEIAIELEALHFILAAATERKTIVICAGAAHTENLAAMLNVLEFKVSDVRHGGDKELIVKDISLREWLPPSQKTHRQTKPPQLMPDVPVHVHGVLKATLAPSVDPFEPQRYWLATRYSPPRAFYLKDSNIRILLHALPYKLDPGMTDSTFLLDHFGYLGDVQVFASHDSPSYRVIDMSLLKFKHPRKYYTRSIAMAVNPLEVSYTGREELTLATIRCAELKRWSSLKALKDGFQVVYKAIAGGEDDIVAPGRAMLLLRDMYELLWARTKDDILVLMPGAFIGSETEDIVLKMLRAMASKELVGNPVGPHEASGNGGSAVFRSPLWESDQDTSK